MYPDWLDQKEYPFAPRSFAIEGQVMHYLDEGQGEAVVMVHGTPEWSFAYRKLIKDLRQQYRVIAPDNLGFGLSDKPSHLSYAPEQQAARLEQFINHLRLPSFTLVVHDFGGPIGLAYALNYPERIKRLVIMNTFMWSVKDEPFYGNFSRLMHTVLGRWLYLDLNVSPRLILKMVYADKTKLTPALHQHYLKVFPDHESRHALLAYARSFTDSSRWFNSLWQARERIKETPALILWGMKDTAFREKELKRLESVFTHATTVRLEQVGHFVQDEAGEEILPIIKDFLADTTIKELAHVH
jgi:haloalkane dehalogenase